MRSDLQCLDHVRVAVVPACLWLIGGGTESRPVMSLQHASRRRAAIEGTLQVKGHDAVSAPTGGPRCFGAALGVRSTAVVTRAFTPRSAGLAASAERAAAQDLLVMPAARAPA